MGENSELKYMDGLSVRYSDQNIPAAFLAVNESIILLNSCCSVIISPDRHQPMSQKIFSLLNDWSIEIIFTDTPASGLSPTNTLLETLTNQRKIVITCYKWYGEGIENTEPFVFSMTNTTKTILVKIKTTAFESTQKRRKVELSVWVTTS